MRILYFLLVIFVTKAKCSSKDEDNLVTYANVAADMLDDPNVQNLGGMVTDFINSENGKNIGNMLLNSINKEAATQQILQGLGSIINQNEASGIDPSVVKNVLGNVIKSSLNENSKEENAEEKFDLNGQILSNLVGSFLSSLKDSKSDKSTFNILPMLSTIGNLIGNKNGENGDSLFSLFSSFLASQEEEKNEKQLKFSIIDKIFSYGEYFISSETGKNMLNSIFGQNVIKVFADSDGKFNTARTMELLQNHSFRRHWIEMLTKRIATVVAYFTDPENQKRFVKTVQYFSNSFLKTQAFPKAALFDAERPDESLTAIFNYASKKYFNYKISAKQYVKPAVQYIRDLVTIGQKRGLFGSGINSKEFSDKLTDTINLEIIEPVIRVYRAYRFTKNNPKCDKYIFCLINQENINEPISLPGLKKGLSRTTSILVSWFVTKTSGTSFWTLYDIITSDKYNCKENYLPVCNDFHIEEEKVTTEFVHNEL